MQSLPVCRVCGGPVVGGMPECYACQWSTHLWMENMTRRAKCTDSLQFLPWLSQTDPLGPHSGRAIDAV